MRGEYEPALAALQESLDAASPFEPYMPFMVAIPLGCLGSAYLDLGERYRDRVLEARQKTLKLLEHPGGVMGGGTAWADLGFCALQLGTVDMAAEVFEKGLTIPTMAMLTQKPRFLVGKALVALARGNSTEAASLVDEACRYVEERQMKHFYPLVAFAAGEVAKAQGKVERALQHFAVADELAQAMQMRPLLLQIRLNAMKVLQAAGRDAEAQAKLLAARQVVDEMAVQIKDETLRSDYLASAARTFEAVSA
jgi:tetratricopeptide (TPR) repeat protein